MTKNTSFRLGKILIIVIGQNWVESKKMKLGVTARISVRESIVAARGGKLFLGEVPRFI